MDKKITGVIRNMKKHETYHVILYYYYYYYKKFVLHKHIISHFESDFYIYPTYL